MKILLIEDNASDAWLFQEAFRMLAIKHDLEVASDGEHALDRLRDGSPPDLILCDINMPKLDGFQVLSAIRQDPLFRLTPVIMISSSRDRNDVRRAHKLGANSYICKPMRDFMDFFGDFERYWLGRAELP